MLPCAADSVKPMCLQQTPKGKLAACTTCEDHRFIGKLLWSTVGWLDVNLMINLMTHGWQVDVIPECLWDEMRRYNTCRPVYLCTLTAVYCVIVDCRTWVNVCLMSWEVQWFRMSSLGTRGHLSVRKAYKVSQSLSRSEMLPIFLECETWVARLKLLTSLLSSDVI